MEPTYLSYDKGTILVRSEAKVPYSTWDSRVRAFRAQALYYREIVEFLKKSELTEIKDGVEDLPPCPDLKCRRLTMRAYQKGALASWDKAGRRGVIILPTGAGKTVIGMKAMELVNQPTIVIVPTLDLLEQWRGRVEEEFGVEVGLYGGGENSVRAITICTYDSAYIRAAELGNRFSLMIFDECVTGDTLVTMADGTTRQIRDINVGDLVRSAANISRRVTHKWARGILPIIQLKLSDGRVLRCTPEHRIFERNGLTEAVKCKAPLCIGKETYGKLPRMSYLQESVHTRILVIQAHEGRSWYKPKIPMPNMWETISQRPTAGRASNFCAHQSQHLGFAYSPLVYREEGRVECFLKTDERGARTRWEPELERLELKAHPKAAGLRSLETEKGVLLLWQNGYSRRSSQGLGQDSQCSRKHHSALSVMSREHSQRRADGGDGNGSAILSFEGHRASAGLDSIQVIQVDSALRDEEVFDIEVDEDHSFFANGIAVSNCHHLPAESFRQIAEMFTTPYRMGLTATYEREDMLHLELPRLIGGVVYRLKPEDLAGRYLSGYTLERVNVELTKEEKEEYETNYRLFTEYLEANRIWMRSPLDFQKFIMRTARDPQARRALLARNRAMSIAFNSQAKVDKLEEILRSNPDERILIFTQHNDLVYRISRRFLLPFITHTTSKDERHEVLKGFREGRFRALATSKVLDEGIDVPEASIGVIVSGTGSSREFIQRLGRLLRKSEGKGQARLIELVSSETSETRTSSRRKRASRGAGVGEGEEDEEESEAKKYDGAELIEE